jgi:glycogenin
MLPGKLIYPQMSMKLMLLGRAPPPPQSRPEAAHFPTQQYTFEDTKRRFHAPQEYPEPPKDMWYNIPETKAAYEEPPKPIFPWEQQAKRPITTRIFSEDYPPSPQLDQPKSPPSLTWADSSGGMEKYIRDIMTTQAEKAKDTNQQPRERRESLVFSGFPALGDRPSLPVTPAPIMTAPFWADEPNKSEEGKQDLPGQEEWVCPQCGFSSNDAAVFHASRSATSPGSPPSVLPALTSTAVHVVQPPQPKHVEQSSPLRPASIQRESSSELSAMSGASTVVPIEGNANLDAPPSPPKQPEPPKEPLRPPAWLTAAIIGDTEEAEENEHDSDPTPPAASIIASSPELTEC